jgi:hypothetical protein
MCSGGDFPPSVQSVAFPKARKRHKCCECGLPIPPGTKYVRTWGIWDGSSDSYAQHEDCRDLLDFISENFCDNEPWTFGSLRDEVGEYSAELTAKLTAIEEKYSWVRT